MGSLSSASDHLRLVADMPEPYKQGYIRALADVEKLARSMEPVGNVQPQHMPFRNLQTRQRAARLTELGSQHLAILRITQDLRERPWLR